MDFIKLTPADIDLFVQLRMDYIRMDRNLLAGFELLSMAQSNLLERELREYFKRHMQTDTLVCMVARQADAIMATAFLALAEKPPHSKNLTGKSATLLNVLTYKQYRRKGIATQIVRLLLKEAQTRGIPFVTLTATEEGRLLYKNLGFSALASEMGLKLEIEE